MAESMRDDQDELERWYDEHAQSLFAFLLGLTHNEADTRDFLQEIFSRLARNPDLMASARSPRALLLRMARNLVVDSARRRDTHNRAIQTISEESLTLFTEPVDADQATFASLLTEALGHLPGEQLEVVHLKLWEDMTFEQISEVLHIPLNTAASRYRYGLEKLRSMLLSLRQGKP